MGKTRPRRYKQDEPISISTVVPKPRGHAAVLRRRSDLSFFLVHLTSEGGGLAAQDRLEAILTTDQMGGCTLRGSPQGFFSALNVVRDDSDLAENIRGVSFTEAPLDQVKHFAVPMEAAGRKYSHFGLVFEQDYIRKSGGNPCFYVSNWPIDRRKALWAMAEDPCLKTSPYRDILLYFNIFGQGSNETPLDFYWEREWRVPGDLRFSHEDVFVALAPEEWHLHFKARFEDLRFIDPEWSNDEILRALHHRGFDE